MSLKSSASRDYGLLKLLLGGLTGLAVASSMMCFVFGPKGILYLVIALSAYSAGQLFLKVFKP
jgi:hypothetical protein